MGFDRARFLTFLASRFGLAVDNLDDEQPLFSSGLLDSFNITEVVLYIEAETGRTVQADDLSFDNLDSVGRILRFAQALEQRSV